MDEGSAWTIPPHPSSATTLPAFANQQAMMRGNVNVPQALPPIPRGRRPAGKRDPNMPTLNIPSEGPPLDLDSIMKMHGFGNDEEDDIIADLDKNPISSTGRRVVDPKKNDVQRVYLDLYKSYFEKEVAESTPVTPPFVEQPRRGKDDLLRAVQRDGRPHGGYMGDYWRWRVEASASIRAKQKALDAVLHWTPGAVTRVDALTEVMAGIDKAYGELQPPPLPPQTAVLTTTALVAQPKRREAARQAIQYQEHANRLKNEIDAALAAMAGGGDLLE